MTSLLQTPHPSFRRLVSQHSLSLGPFGAVRAPRLTAFPLRLRLPRCLPWCPVPVSLSSSSYALMISGALAASVPPRAPLAPLDLNAAATNNGGANPGITRADLFKTLRLAYTGRASASSSPAADAASIGQSSGSRVRRARPAASPAAGRAVAAAALPAASVIQLKFWPALPVPAARPLHICRRPLPSCSRIVAISADSPAAFST